LGTDVTEFKLSFGKAYLATYITHWNTTRRQVKLKGLTPAQYRDQALREAA
jgi:L-lactate dehydrogenase (cytochrome)